MHNEISNIDRDRALLDPTSVFTHPEVVVSCNNLDPETKIKIEIRRRWG